MENCTENHPLYIGTNFPDPQDMQFANLVGQIPYIGSLAGPVVQAIFSKGGPVCFKDDSQDLRSDWNREIKAAIGVGILAVIAFGIYAYKKLRKK